MAEREEREGVLDKFLSTRTALLVSSTTYPIIPSDSRVNGLAVALAGSPLHLKLPAVAARGPASAWRPSAVACVDRRRLRATGNVDAAICYIRASAGGREHAPSGNGAAGYGPRATTPGCKGSRRGRWATCG